ncbi:hypothetical protein [Sphingomonas sp.]|jgi:hypothetical protein|uniref:spike base protein, RCAP_Rcc01079 family n=1 Tax=Sphingomonas sp. TaxID=28214 RepID=UPI0035C85EEE
MEDRFDDQTLGSSAPATRARSVTPSDVVELPFLPRAIYVGGNGDVALRGEDGADAVWRNVPAGTILPFRATMVRASGTTATALLALD